MIANAKENGNQSETSVLETAHRQEVVALTPESTQANKR